MSKKPDYHYTYPSDRAYFDDKTSTAEQLAPTDPSKTGADYGISDPQKVEIAKVGRKTTPSRSLESPSGSGSFGD